MVRAAPVQSSFNAGELSPLMEARVDNPAYAAGCATMDNFIPRVQGPAERRPGTRHVSRVKDMTDTTFLIPFIFDQTDAYVLEFGDQYIRFYTDRGTLVEAAETITNITQTNPAVVTITGGPYANGNEIYIDGVVGMTEVNGEYYRLANKSGSTYELTDLDGNNIDATGFTAYASGGEAFRVYEIASPYLASDLIDANGSLTLDFVQTGDVIYIVHPDFAPRKLVRTAATNWAISVVTLAEGPWNDRNTDETLTVYASAATGTGITLTASASLFTTTTDIGRLIRIESEDLSGIDAWEVGISYTANDLVVSDGKVYEAQNTATSGTLRPTHDDGEASDGAVNWLFKHAFYGIAQITAVASGTSATANVLVELPGTVVGASNATYKHRLGAFSATSGYPSRVTFFRERLTFAKDQTLYFSQSADFENFAIDISGTVTDECAITATLSSDQVNTIQWISPGRGLLVGTLGAEFAIGELTTTEPFAPGNFKAEVQTGYGGRAIKPIRAGNSSLYVHSDGRQLRELQYVFQSDGFESTDMNVRADTITGAGLIALAYQQEPYNAIWAVRQDGLLLSFTYYRQEQVLGWSRHNLGGTDAVVESISSIPSPDGGQDDVWMTISRTVNGGTVRYVEYIEEGFDEFVDAQEDAFYVDSGLTYDGSPVTTIAGLDHLIGESVNILADGAVIPAKTVDANGEILLDNAASVVQAGLAQTARLATMRFEAGSRDGTAQGKTKRIERVTFRFYNTLGGTTGPDESTLDDIPEVTFRAPATLMGSAAGLFTGDADLAFPSGYNRDARVWYVNSQPLPVTLLAIMPQMVTYDP